MKTTTFFRTYWESILVTAVILYLSFAPVSTFKSVPMFKHADKIVHFVMYFFLTIVLLYDSHNKNKISYKNIISVCIIFPIALGGLVEILQGAFFKPRSASWADWLADIVGVLLAWFLMSFLRKRKEKENGITKI